MSDGKSFWSTVPGVVTGAAGVISAIVGLLGISVQLGWLGGDDKATVSSSSGDAVATTTLATVRGATSTVFAARQGEFAVDPESATFEPLKAKDATVTVKNTGDVPLTMRPPNLTGAGEANFEVTDEDCTPAPVAVGRSCEITVTFTTSQPGDYAAKLVVAASNVPKQVEVTLKGTRGLLG